MNVDSPYRIDERGRTAETDRSAHIRDLIAEVLFTRPGERVNRPDFGAGLLERVFEMNDEHVAAALQMLVRGALQQWLGELIRVEDVVAESRDATLAIEVRYVELVSEEPGVARIGREL